MTKNLKAVSTLRAVLEIICRCKSTMGATLDIALILSKMQSVHIQMNYFTTFYCFSKFRFYLACFTTATHSDIIMFIPLHNWNKEKHEVCICHIYFNVSIFSAKSAYLKLIKLEFFLSAADSHYKKHLA